MEESTDPEEDSGLPQRYELDGEASEEEHAEEDLEMIQTTVTNDFQGMPNNGIDILSENADNSEAAPVNDFHSNPESSVVLDSGGPREGTPEQNHSFLTQREHFFEEDENMLIADCGNNVRCEIGNAVETNLSHSNSLIPSHPEQSNALKTENGILKPQVSDSEPNLRSMSAESLENNLESAYIEHDVVDLSQTVNAVYKDADRNLSAEDNLELCIGQHVLDVRENIQQNSASISLDISLEAAEADLYITNTESIPCAIDSLVNKHDSVVFDMQNLESNEQSILDKDIPNNTMPEANELAADEITGLVQILPDGSSVFPAESSAMNMHAGQELVLGASVVGRNLSPPVKSCVDNFDVQTCGSESLSESVLANAEHKIISKVQDVQVHPISSPAESCLYQPTDILQHNVASCDYSTHINLPQADSQQNGHLENDPHCYNNISSHNQRLEYSSQNYSSDSCSSSPVVSSCSATLNIEGLTSNQGHCFEFSSEGSSPASSLHASPAKAISSAVAMGSSHSSNEQTSVEQIDSEEEVDLNEKFHHYTSESSSPQKTSTDKKASLSDNRLSGKYINGLQSPFDVNQIKEYNKQLLEQLQIRDEEITKLTSRLNSIRETEIEAHSREEAYQLSPSHHADDLYLPQIKVLELTITQQQREIQELKAKLISQDNSAKRAITTLQHELKSRVEQVTKLYEECRKEKDMIVVRFAESEAKHIEAKRIVERSEAKVKEAMRDKDLMMNALKAAKVDKQKALTNFEMKCIEVSNFQKEIEKLKEAVNSSDHRIKWFQNKLKEELESHKETKSNLEKITAKLKEAREETELIRKECQAIVKRYQESEEIKSNSLDKELKLKETELKTQIQEMSDTEEIHQMLKKELDSLKTQHKDVIEEVKIYKDKVNCLEEERMQNHQMIENYQEIMQRQKTSIAELNIKITSLSRLDEEYHRSQDIIQALQKEIADLQMTNHDLQKDMESCSERESKMLTLQSELSHTNALLRSENSSLSNKILSLTSEVETRKMEVRALEESVRDLSDKRDKEKIKRKEEGDKMSAILTEKTKECNDLRQKWEDEMDSRKTLKRQHASNIKDLTRQLHQMHKRLESIEGKGDAGSMGSRTNSNGSLNSLENSSRQSFPVNHAPVQEFPAITEQIEVDKQVLIERIVRLQKSLARKNEKLEFLGEHVQQLLEDIRKKNKIIQMYALREESGTLTSEDMDANKTLLARKGGIMASLYSAHQQDGTMTLELSLQISRKLQAVLEDTLLKNMTLKESLDTLGEEIARLSQENRRMQLHLQKLEGSLA
ncbi:hypothetical protein BsWGS_05404 [Bradybaena similaris]